MIDRHGAEDVDGRLDEVLAGIIGPGQPCDLLAEKLERALGKGGEETASVMSLTTTSSPRDPVALRSSRVTTQFGALIADSSGSPDDRPPLVLLHGLTFNRTTWRPVLDELDAIDPGRRIVAFDLPGHGASRPLTTTHGAEEVAAAVRQAVLAANLEAPVIVGHSISAVLATVYAALYPTTAVVNVDQSLRVGPFAALVKSLDERIRGPEFPPGLVDVRRQHARRTTAPGGPRAGAHHQPP